MSAGLVLALALGAASGAEPAPEASSARWVLEPPAVEVGEPVRARLEIAHPLGSLPALTSTDLALDASWVVLDARPRVTLPDPDEEGRALSAWTWELASLEGGERALPALAFSVDGAAGQPVPAASLEVVGVLASHEDAPRPPRGFRPLPPEPTRGAAPWAWLVGGGLLALAVAGLVARRLALRRARRDVEPPPAERLQRLVADAGEGPEGVRALFYGLSALVREATDRELGRDRRAATDEEWLAALCAEGAVEGERLRALEDVLSRCAAVKYAGAGATPWTVDEVVGEARAALVAAAGEERR